MVGMRLKYRRYTELKLFFVVSLLVGATLCVVQNYGIFNRFDRLFFDVVSPAEYHTIPVAVNVLIVMFFTMFPGIIILEEGVVKGIVYTVAAWFFYAVLIHSYINVFHFFMPLSTPLLGSVVSVIRVLGWGSSMLEAEKKTIKETFGYFVEPSIAAMALDNPGLLKEDGVRKTVTIMFADLRGFATLCETVEPELIITVLRECFSRLISTARQNGGTIDKLIGDSLMVVWGNPIPQDDHAERAVDTAVEMQAVMQCLKAKWQRRLGVEIGLGIGINTAEVVVGTIGSKEYCDYTVLGNGVNLASRIEANCPGGEIHLSAATLRRLSRQEPFEQLDYCVYKNITEQAEIYRLCIQQWVLSGIVSQDDTAGGISCVEGSNRQPIAVDCF